jgi:L-serine deaminase
VTTWRGSSSDGASRLAGCSQLSSERQLDVTRVPTYRRVLMHKVFFKGASTGAVASAVVAGVLGVATATARRMLKPRKAAGSRSS